MNVCMYECMFACMCVCIALCVFARFAFNVVSKLKQVFFSFGRINKLLAKNKPCAKKPLLQFVFIKTILV